MQALTVFLSVLGGLLAVFAIIAIRRHGARTSAIVQLRRTAFGDARTDVIAVFDEDGRGPFLAAVHGDRTAVAENVMSPQTARPGQISAATLIQDEAGNVGMRLELGGRTLVTTGLEALMRLYGQLAAANTPLRCALAGEAGHRGDQQIGELHDKERQMLVQWLASQEKVIDVLDDVRYEGSLPSGESGGTTKLVVTNLRLGLAVQTVTFEEKAARRTRITHFYLVGHQLPHVESVQATSATKLRNHAYRWSFRYRPDSRPAPDGKAPDLVLRPGDGAVMFPVAVCQTPINVTCTAPQHSRLYWEILWGGVAFGILGGILGGVPFALYYGVGSDTHWMEAWIPAVVAGGVMAGIGVRALSTLEAFLERGVEAAMAASRPEG